jgi:hypothetical protein
MTFNDDHLSRLSWSPDGTSLVIGSTSSEFGVVVRRLDWPARSVTQLARDATISEESVAAGPDGRVFWTIDTGSGSSNVFEARGNEPPSVVASVQGQPFLLLNWQGDAVIGAVSSASSIETIDIVTAPLAIGQRSQVVATVDAASFGSVWASTDGWIVVQGEKTLVIHDRATTTTSVPGRFASLDPDRSHFVYVDPATALLMRRAISGGPTEGLVEGQVWEGVVSSAGVIAYRAAGSFNTLCFAKYPPPSK